MDGGALTEFSSFRDPPIPSASAFDQHLLDFGDRLARIQPLRTSARTVENCMTPIKPERIFQGIQSFACCLIAAIRKPPVRLKENCRTQETVAVPPMARTA